MLSEEEFNSIKDISYEEYLIDLVIKYSNGASGNWGDYKTSVIETIFLKLKEKYISLDNIFKLIEQRNDGKPINEGWLSPGFMMLFD